MYGTGRKKGLAASTAGLWGGPIGGSNGGCIVAPLKERHYREKGLKQKTPLDRQGSSGVGICIILRQRRRLTTRRKAGQNLKCKVGGIYEELLTFADVPFFAAVRVRDSGKRAGLRAVLPPSGERQ